MRTARLIVTLVAAAAASRLLALRVEVAPVRPAAAGTVMAIAVQVAPEDRARLGREAWLRAELSRDRSTVDRLARPVAVDADGRATTEVEWPPGSYQLRVDIESTGGEHSGFWVMDLEVPDLESAAAPPSPEPASASGPEPASPPAPVPVAVPERSPDARAAITPEPVPAPAVISSASAVIAPPVAAPAPPDEAVTTPPEPAAPWSEPAPDQLEVTVAATRDGRAVLGLTAVDLVIRTGGVQRDAMAVLGGPAVPLELGLVVALSGAGGVDAETVGRILARTAARGAGVLGGVTLVAGSDSAARRLSWDEAMVELPALLAAAGTTTAPDLPAMMTAALDGLGERGGRRFVLVVTDGRDGASRVAWRDLEQRMAVAAAPLLVIGLWTPEFRARTQGRLSDLAVVAGGSAFFVQGLERLQTTLERDGDLVTASRVVRLLRPAGAAGGVPVQVEAVDPAVTVLAPPQAR